MIVYKAFNADMNYRDFPSKKWKIYSIRIINALNY